MKFSKFMASLTGRILRVVVGILLIVWGISLQSVLGYIIAIIGLVPFTAGLFDWCVLAPLMHMPFSGKAIRAYEPKK